MGEIGCFLSHYAIWQEVRSLDFFETTYHSMCSKQPRERNAQQTIARFFFGKSNAIDRVFIDRLDSSEARVVAVIAAIRATELVWPLGKF